MTADKTAGTADAPNLQIGTVTLNGVSGSPTPPFTGTVGTVVASSQIPSVGQTSTFVYVFPTTTSASPATGGRVTIGVSGTYTGGTFNTGQRAVAP